MQLMLPVDVASSSAPMKVRGPSDSGQLYGAALRTTAFGSAGMMAGPDRCRDVYV
jgi:hypothetical protein